MPSGPSSFLNPRTRQRNVRMFSSLRKGHNGNSCVFFLFACVRRSWAGNRAKGETETSALFLFYLYLFFAKEKNKKFERRCKIWVRLRRASARWRYVSDLFKEPHAQSCMYSSREIRSLDNESSPHAALKGPFHILMLRHLDFRNKFFLFALSFLENLKLRKFPAKIDTWYKTVGRWRMEER